MDAVTKTQGWFLDGNSVFYFPLKAAEEHRFFCYFPLISQITQIFASVCHEEGSGKKFDGCCKRSVRLVFEW
jgi:hypothetical protein